MAVGQTGHELYLFKVLHSTDRYSATLWPMVVAFVSLTLDIALYQIAQFRKNRQHRRDNTAIIRKTAEEEE